METISGSTIAIVKNARRLWHWRGAASISELAERGSSKPKECMFPRRVQEVLLCQVIEIDLLSEEAAKNIDSIEEWSR